MQEGGSISNVLVVDISNTCANEYKTCLPRPAVRAIYGGRDGGRACAIGRTQKALPHSRNCALDFQMLLSCQ